MDREAVGSVLEMKDAAGTEGARRATGVRPFPQSCGLPLDDGVPLGVVATEAPCSARDTVPVLQIAANDDTHSRTTAPSWLFRDLKPDTFEHDRVVFADHALFLVT